MNRKNLGLAVAFALFSLAMYGQKSFKVLFVNDNSLIAYNTDTVLSALNHTGYPYDIFNAVDSLRSPTFSEMADYNLVIWYCSTNGVGNYLWSGNDSDNPELVAYLETGGNLWVMGNDFLYDRYATPHTFSQGEFVWDYLGIEEYYAQSYADDGGLGVPELDLASAGYSTVQTINWIFPTLYWIDACIPRSSATSVYEMGPDTYALSGYSSAIQYANDGHLALSFYFDPALMDTYSNRLQLFTDILSRFQLFSGVDEVNSKDMSLRAVYNSANKTITIKLPGKLINQTIEIQLYDLNGRSIQCLTTTPGSQTIEMNPEFRSEGVYLIRVKSKGEIVSTKIGLFRTKSSF